MSLELDSLNLLDAEVEKLKKEFVKENKPSFDREAYLRIKAMRKPRILAVDDEVGILNSLRAILHNYHFVGTSSSAAALGYLLKHDAPDLYIFDIDMPNINGFELAKHIERMGKKTVYMFLTSNSDHDSLLEAVNCGATDFIIKPCRSEIILKKISNIFGE